MQNKAGFYRKLFMATAIYDLALGIGFLAVPGAIFSMLGIADKMPAFPGYLALLGAFVLVLGILYLLLARGDLKKNQDMVLVGALYKLAYSATAFFFLAAGTLPHPAFAVLGAIDLILFVLILQCYFWTKKT